MELSAGKSTNLGFQQLLETPAHDVWDQAASGGALHELAQLGGATMGEGHDLCSVWWWFSEQGHRPAHPLPQLKSEGGEPSAPA